MTRLAPDTQTEISLIGTTERLAHARGDRDAAIAELQAIAHGRTDLLAQAAGHFLGSQNYDRAACHQLLVDAGATDTALIEAAAERTRSNLANYGHTTAGTRAPGSSLSS